MDNEIQEGQTTPTDEGQKVVEEQTSEKKEQTKTISDVVGEEVDASKDTKEVKKPSVFSDMISFKKENKELKRELKEQREQMNSLMDRISNKSVGLEEVDKFAEKWDIPPDFVSELKGMVKSNSSVEELKEEVQSLKERDEEEKRQVRLNDAIEKELSRVLNQNPEYKEFCNVEAVKSYAKLNTNKSMESIILELYGNIINSKSKNIEDYSSSGKGYDKEIDYSNPSGEEAKAILENPKLQEKYGKNLVERLKKSNL